MHKKEIIHQLESMKDQIQRQPKSQLNYREDYQKYCEQMRQNDAEKELEKQYIEEYKRVSKKYAKELGYEVDERENDGQQTEEF